MDEINISSQRPYFIRAIYEWLVDNDLTPYITVDAEWAGVQVPPSTVQKGHVTLNISMTAVNGLELGNEVITFKARFAGASRTLIIPIDAVRAIYARENGAGMPLPSPLREGVVNPSEVTETVQPVKPTAPKMSAVQHVPASDAPVGNEKSAQKSPTDAPKRPHLRVVK